MNTTNPFQIPVCLQRADSERRRRERFKRGIIAVVAGIVVLLVGLLIQGCVSEKSTRTVSSPNVTDQQAPRPSSLIAAQKPEAGLQPNLNTVRSSVASVSNTGRTAAAGRSNGFYVVKSGDTLARIAKVNGTTVKALKTANRLKNDGIGVGVKLIIPEV
jgi:LysM repeat protein